jgi:hypothetical protein
MVESPINEGFYAAVSMTREKLFSYIKDTTSGVLLEE